MSDEFTNVLVRMSAALKAELQREASINDRKLTQEINVRLRESLKPATASAGKRPYSVAVTTPALSVKEEGPMGLLSGTDQAMLTVFRALPVEKQLALLSLLR